MQSEKTLQRNTVRNHRSRFRNFLRFESLEERAMMAVVSSGDNSVKRYDGITGAFIDVFIPSKRGGLAAPADLLFNNGNLYVASQGSNQVLRFDATTGAFMDAVDPANSVAMDRPIGLLAAVDGSLLVGSFGKIHRLGASTNAVFAVNVSSYWPTTVTVVYQTANVNAQSGTDYQSSSGPLTFLPGGPRTQAIVIPTMEDSNIEPAETFTVTLSNASGASIFDPQGIGTIFDNDTKFYVVDDSTLNKNFEYADNGTPGESYNLASGSPDPRGVASTASGNKVWVVDKNRNVYVYNAHSTLLGSWTAGSLNGSSIVEGITVHGNDVWIVDNKADKVFKYAGAANRLVGSHSASANPFPLAADNKNPKDLVTDGTYIWVVDDGASIDKVFRYDLNGINVKSWTIDSANKAPTGITIDPNTGSSQSIWIVDIGTDKVYEYTNARGIISGSQPAAANPFALAPGNTNPQGIADPPVLMPGSVAIQMFDNQSVAASALAVPIDFQVGIPHGLIGNLPNETHDQEQTKNLFQNLTPLAPFKGERLGVRGVPSSNASEVKLAAQSPIKNVSTKRTASLVDQALADWESSTPDALIVRGPCAQRTQ